MFRRIDRLGRIVLPMELRRALGIKEGDALMISQEGEQIVLRKMETACTFCGSVEHLSPHRSKLVCRTCTVEMAHRVVQRRVATS